MSIPTFEERRQQWSSPPVDDVGYLSSRDLLKLTADDFRKHIRMAELNRYRGWRNHKGAWRRVLGLDSTHGKYVLDYGCGIGIEALQYCRAGNDVAIFDISDDNVRVAMRTLTLEGFHFDAYTLLDGHTIMHLPGQAPRFDVIHCAGVLHHIPSPKEVMRAFHGWLSPQGEVRLMLYSDVAWKIATGSEPPRGSVEDHPDFTRYWQHWDAAGGYADWYDEARLAERFGEWFTLEAYEPLTEYGEYVGAILRRRS